MQKTVLGTKEIVEYKGECPDCKKEQKSFFEQEVDVPCWECSKRRQEAKIKEKYKHLIGAVIIDVFGCNNLTNVKIKTVDGEEFEIESHREFGENDYDKYLITEKVEIQKRCSKCGIELKEH